MRGAPGVGAATRARILQVADSLGYRPDHRAKLLRQLKSRLLGVSYSVGQDFHGDLVDGIYQAAAAADYHITLSAVTQHRTEADSVDSLLADRCEGVILIGPTLPAATLTEVAGTLPTVALCRTADIPGLVCVCTDDTPGLAAAVDHLVSLGHTSIALADGGGAPMTEERVTGFWTAIEAYGFRESAHIITSGDSEEAGVQAGRALLELSPRPTAIIAFNDLSAVGILSVLERAHIAVPREISVTGYDDSRLASLSTVQLTTIRQDAVELARRAVADLIDRVEAGDETPEPTGRTILVPPSLVVRHTTGLAASPTALRSTN
jgi:DNA-binding LacI/PurR family transcriptional regulator